MADDFIHHLARAFLHVTRGDDFDEAKVETDSRHRGWWEEAKAEAHKFMAMFIAAHEVANNPPKSEEPVDHADSDSEEEDSSTSE